MSALEESKGFELGMFPAPACGEVLWSDVDPWAVRILRTGASKSNPTGAPVLTNGAPP